MLGQLENPLHYMNHQTWILTLTLFTASVSEVIIGSFRDKLINILSAGLLTTKLNLTKPLAELRHTRMGAPYIYFPYFCFPVKIIAPDWKPVVALPNADIPDSAILELHRQRTEDSLSMEDYQYKR